MLLHSHLSRLTSKLDTSLRKLSEKLGKKTYSSYLFLIILFALLLFFNNKTLMVLDDYIYSFIFTTQDKITSISDVIESQYLHYIHWGGRLVAHTLLQTLLLCTPLTIDILNSIVFVFLILLLSYHVRGNLKLPNVGLLVGLFLSVWIFQPAFAETCLWITGAANYLWGMVIILLFLLPYRLYRGDTNKKWLVAIMPLLGVVAGCMNENTSAAMIIIVILFMCLYRKSWGKIPLWAMMGLIGALVGYLIMVIAPGNFARAEGVTNEPFVFLYRFLTHTQSFVYYLGTLNLLIFILGMLYVNDKLSINRQVFNICLIYGIGVLASVYSMVLSPSFPPRAWFGPIIFNIIVLGVIFDNLDISKVYIFRIKCGMLFFGLLIFGFTLYDGIRDVSNISDTRIAREIAIEEGRGTNSTVFIQKSQNRTKYGLGDNPNSYVTNYMSAYYGVKIVNEEEKKTSE